MDLLRDDFGWTDYDAEPAATIPGEPIAIYGEEEDPDAYLIERDNVTGYSIQRKDHTYVINPDTMNAIFPTPDQAKRQFAQSQ